MKKLTRIISLLSILAICLSLCGCQYLDDLRAVQGKVTAPDTIQLQDGTEYKLLSQTCEEFNPTFTRSTTFHIAEEEEVPLLLTSIVCASAYRSEDGLFLKAYLDTTAEPEIYCRTDAYDSVMDRINNGFTLSVYRYQYFNYEIDNYEYYTLTPEQAAAVDLVYSTQEPEKLPEAAKLDYTSIVDLYLYSDDYLFMKDTVDICLARGQYFVVAYGNMLYSVPAELTHVFEGIMAAELRSSSWYG